MLLYCRLCLAAYPKRKLFNIFKCNLKHTKDSLVEILFWVFAVEIDVTDTFTKEICDECLSLIEYVIQIRNVFKKNQENLSKAEKNNSSEKLNIWPCDDVDANKDMDFDQPGGESSATSINSKDSNTESIPKVRVTLAALETLCSLKVNLVKLEDSPEYKMYYERLKNMRYKRRKYRHFKLDNDLLEDICSTLDDKKHTNPEAFKKNRRASAGPSVSTRAVNPRVNPEKSHIGYSLRSIRRSSKNPRPRRKSLCYKADMYYYDGYDLDVFQSPDSEVFASMPLPEYRDTNYLPRSTICNKNVSTESVPNNSFSKNGINNVKVDMVKGTSETSADELVPINAQALDELLPNVCLEPLECTLKRGNYKKIDNLSYVINRGAPCGESEIDVGGSSNIIGQDGPPDITQDIIEVKKQRFVDYYNNFSSFAVRELIAGKKIRDSNSTNASIFKVSDVRNVFVCQFCSKSFLSQTSLQLHCSRTHKSFGVPDLDDRDTAPSIIIPNDSKKSISTRLSEKLEGFRNSSSRLHVDSRNLTNKNMKGNLFNNSFSKRISKIGKRKGELRRSSKRVQGNWQDKQTVTKGGNNDSLKDSCYIWDKKRLGPYSAITFYKKHEPVLNTVLKKQDVALNATIQKLADRLDETADGLRSDLSL